MKALLTFACLLVGTICTAQVSLGDWQTNSDQNIIVERLAGDSLSTSFIIEIKERVPLHYHGQHSEHIYVLDGTCSFRLNNDTLKLGAGDYVFIPSKSLHAVWVSGHKPLKVLSIQSPHFEGKDGIPVKE